MRTLMEDPADRGRRRGIPRRLAARCDGAARMEGAWGDGVSRPLRAGIIAALLALALDQASKFWLLGMFDLGRRGVVPVTPFFDLVLAWNVGISFGWFQNDSPIAQVLLTSVKAAA